jgi:KUP system potassium uptake protein
MSGVETGGKVAVGRRGTKHARQSTPGPAHTAPAHPPKGGLLALTIGATGIVYGDIGTSPLYALNAIFFGQADLAPTRPNVLGGLSLVIWTLTVVVAIKYALLVMRANQDGEGGIFALYGLLHPYKRRGAQVLLWALMLGGGFLFGDGVITPAISVLASVEGLKVAAPAIADTVIPITVLLLTALFAVQFKGTSGIGSVFGPVVLIWFVVIAVLGAEQIESHPAILAAFNPIHGLRFLWHAGVWEGLLIVGALMLVTTGAEAMYADMGHFGAAPIRLSWFAIVYPALLLNYLGQGAYLLGEAPVAGRNLFFSLVPAGMLYPMVLLATIATIIASQALISGAFTLASQAIRLGLFPRLAIRHTHHAHAGQIYMPFINWLLYVGCVLLVVTFGSSAALGSAYGLAVSGVMVITSVAMIVIARAYWNWGRVRTGVLWGAMTAINVAFLLANMLKLLNGGWVPLTIGAAVFAVMVTWQWGRKITFAAYQAKRTMTMAELVELHRASSVFFERNAILMAARPLRRPSDLAPALMRLLWDRYGILPRNLIFVEVTHRTVPYIHGDRYQVTVFDRDSARGSIIGVELQFGFMEEPNVEHVLEGLAAHHLVDLPTDPHLWIVHVLLEHLLPSRRMRLIRRLRFHLFLLLRRLSQPAHTYYGLGDEVQLSAELIPVRVR